MALDARLVSAKPLDRETIGRVEKKFTELYKQPVRMACMVDDQILGGLIVEIDGKVWDGSLRKRLQSSVETLVLEGFTGSADEMIEQIRESVEMFVPEPQAHPVGKVVSMGDGIVRIDRMVGCRNGELLRIGEDVYAIALNLEHETVAAALLGNQEKVLEGAQVEGTGRVVEVPVGEPLLGRVVNPLGLAIDGGTPIKTRRHRPIEAEAPSIMERQAVNQPLETGILAIDSMIPIGKGQRELIIGDRQTGKSSIAIDTILNQRGKNVLCVYVAIGQKASTIASVHRTLFEGGAMSYTCIVCATASDPAPMQYIAPYAGCAIAEEFMYAGRDVLIVYDDLSKHAVAYRALSLLLKRPSGREAYPGDVFYLHSRLLERAARLNDEWGGGTMTALPVVETMSGDISAYIPTNVISITDGQIFLESELFHSGVRPAINVGLSVSRVGGSAQTKAMRAVSGRLRLELAQYRELSVFAQFGSDLEKTTQDLLRQGERITEALKQPLHAPMGMPEQVVLLYAVTRGLLSGLTPQQVAGFRTEFMPHLRVRYPMIFEAIQSSGQLTEETGEQIKSAIEGYLSTRTVV